jgi:hypothetical protein
MTDLQKRGDLEIDEDLPFQRRMWVAQRIGWALMTLVMLAGLLGAFGGGGFLARARAGREGDSIWLDYRRLTRHGAPDALEVHVSPDAQAGRDSIIGIWFQRDYIHGLDIQQIIPEPAEVIAGPDRVTYRFKSSDPFAVATVVFRVEPAETFSRRGQLGIEGSASSRTFRQFVFP